jgi:ABC-2 type transport system ATP-binding protein
VKSVIAEHLVKTYRNGEVKALNDLSIDVEEGTVLGVLGPNGAGDRKSVV